MHLIEFYKITKHLSLYLVLKKDPQFHDLMRTLNSVSSELHHEGIGPQRKIASVITYKDENALWERGLLGDDSPRILQHTVFYYAGMHFCSRGIQEQYDMRQQQLITVPKGTKDAMNKYIMNMLNLFPKIINIDLKIRNNASR